MTGPDRLRVAVLDDDQLVRTAIGRLLSASGMATELFATSLELFDFLADGEFDCLILDYQMPGMNGLDVLDLLDRARARFPTLVMTAHDRPDVCDACLKAGAFAYLRKPLDAGELLVTIANAVAARRS